jgi:hypothetical protein
MPGNKNSGPNANTPRCGGKKRYKGENGEDLFCRRPAGWGTEHKGFGHCSRHGGSTPMALVQAARWQVNTEAERQLKKLGEPTPVNDPLTELAKVTGEVVAWKEVMGERVASIAEADWRYEHRNGEMLRAEILLWERALDRCERFLTAMARLNIDERLARIDEQQAELIIKAVQAVLRDLGMTLDEQENARKQLARHLRVANPIVA